MTDDRSALYIEVPPTLTRAFANELLAKLDGITDATQLVIFAGQSADVFCLGMDLESTSTSRESEHSEGLRAIGKALIAVHGCALPTVAVVRGRAVGGGVGIAAACDWVIAEEGATFALPEMLWGFVPAAIWPLVVERIGPARARRWAMTACARDAAGAREAGLVAEVVRAGESTQALRRSMRQLLRVDRHAIGMLRAWTEDVARMPVAAAIAKGAERSADQLADERVQARLRSFFIDGDVPWRTS